MGNILRTLEKKEYSIGEELPPIDCFRCGLCCQRYQPKVSLKEIEVISKRLGIVKDKFVTKYVQQVPTKEGFLLQRSEKGCVFLSFDDRDEKAGCIIYSVRPKACRDWTASLSRLECREGLIELEPRVKIMTLKDLYSSKKSIHKIGKAVSSSIKLSRSSQKGQNWTNVSFVQLPNKPSLCAITNNMDKCYLNKACSSVFPNLLFLTILSPPERAIKKIQYPE